MTLSKEQIETIKSFASILVDDGSNEEYTRGICELIAEFDGRENVDHADRADEIRNEIIKE